MRKLLTLVLQGLLALAPFAITLYFCYWLGSSLETLFRPYIPYEYYQPGVGLAVGLVVLILVGLLVNAYLVRWSIRWVERLLVKIPVIKSVYGTLQDIVMVFNIGKEKDMQRVVSVSIDNKRLIGFITSQTSGEMLFGDKDVIGVYIPMSYQIGGFTVYVNKDQLTELDIGVEQAMRIALTGGAQRPTKVTIEKR